MVVGVVSVVVVGVVSVVVVGVVVVVVVLLVVGVVVEVVAVLEVGVVVVVVWRQSLEARSPMQVPGRLPQRRVVVYIDAPDRKTLRSADG